MRMKKKTETEQRTSKQCHQTLRRKLSYELPV